jgi:hypothetical protein
MADEVLDSQIAYYRAQAAKYDDWWFCRGRHDLGQEGHGYIEADARLVLKRYSLGVHVELLWQLRG